jgi:hypothetical protein
MLTGPHLALARQIRDGGASAPPESLPVADMLRELEATARAALEGRFMRSSADRASLRQDLASALTPAGPKLTLVLGAALDDLKDELNKLPGLVAETSGATIALGHARALMERLVTAASAHAAWQDVVSAFQDGEAVAVCELRIAQLRTITEHRGNEWSEVASRLRGVVADSALSVALAQGVADHSVDPRASSGLGLDERLELAKRVAAEDPPQGAVVVWLAYVNAHLQAPFCLELSDRLRLYGSQLWDDNHVLSSGSYPRPAELDDPHRSIFFRDRPADTFVLLRVDLGLGARHGARARARAVAEVLPDLVDTSSGWRLMEGEVGWVDGAGWFGSSSLEDPAEKTVRSRGCGDSSPKGDGWFVLNAREARWRHAPGRSAICEVEGEQDFLQLGINLSVLRPGETAMYHWEADQEDFLVTRRFTSCRRCRPTTRRHVRSSIPHGYREEERRRCNVHVRTAPYYPYRRTPSWETPARDTKCDVRPPVRRTRTRDRVDPCARRSASHNRHSATAACAANSLLSGAFGRCPTFVRCRGEPES